MPITIERLDSREIEGAAQRLAALDKNGDGQMTPDELPEVLLIGLARGSLENADATFAPPPVIVRRADDKAPRWFTAMDANSDGAISRREFLGSAEKFAELDKDGNGLLELSEVATRQPEALAKDRRPPSLDNLRRLRYQRQCSLLWLLLAVRQ